MKKFLAIVMTLCMIASVLCVSAFAEETTSDAVLRVRALKKNRDIIDIETFNSFEMGWEAAIDLAMNGEKMDEEKYDRVIVDLLADWNANDAGEFGDSDLDGFRQSTIHCPSNIRLTINMNGHTIDRNLKEEEYDGEVIFIDDKANVIINGGNDSTANNGEVAGEGMIGTITGGWSCNGAGGIHIADNAVVTLNNINVSGNAVEDDKGAGIAVYEGSSLVMNGGSISNNCLYLYFDTFERTEGALYVDEAKVVLNDVVISRNSADNGEAMGVAISLNSSCNVTLNRCYVLENSSKDGEYLHSLIYLDDSDCELVINDSYIIDNGRPTYSIERRTWAALAVSNGKLTLNKCEIHGNKTYMMVHSSEYSTINSFNECAITDNSFSVIGDFKGEFSWMKAEHTFTKCQFNNNHSSEESWYTFAGDSKAKITMIDCDMGDSTYEDKAMIEFINTGSGRALSGSIFGTGSMAIIVSVLALVASVSAICISVTTGKKKTVAATTNKSDE